MISFIKNLFAKKEYIETQFSDFEIIDLKTNDVIDFFSIPTNWDRDRVLMIGKNYLSDRLSRDVKSIGYKDDWILTDDENKYRIIDITFYKDNCNEVQ